ncbi:MAG: DUF1801 domain-containing protein [Ardenticatenaceae bacterium]|nr:DUF1801 domain-containing protein [Ardenticatenaceae bacterium]MCB8988017.1 DUF1801 domain-containing protein [Ardenticatenaceae bacterium]
MTEKSPAVDDYLQSLPPERRAALETLRSWIAETLPDAREVIAYNMPGVAQDDLICSFKSQKNYLSLYMDVEVVAAHQAELAHLNCGKSCLRFRRIDQLPEGTIKQMLAETAVKQAKEASA